MNTKTPDYEIIFQHGKPRALTLNQEDCSSYGRFVALSNHPADPTLLVLTDTEGKSLPLLHPGETVDFSSVDLDITVYILSQNGETSNQFDVFVEI